MKRTLLLISLCCLSAAMWAQQKTFNCTVKGEVLNGNTTAIKIYPSEKDPRFNGWEVPVVDKKFEYTFTDDAHRLYEVALKSEMDMGSWRYYNFVSEADTVNMTLYQVNFQEGERRWEEDSLYYKHKISGGAINGKYYQFQKLFSEQKQTAEIFQDQMKPLYESGEYMSSKGRELYQRLDQARDSSQIVKNNIFAEIRKLQEKDRGKEFYSEAMFSLVQKQDSIITKALVWKYNFLSKNIDQAYYSLLLNPDRALQLIDTAVYIKTFKMYAKKFPKHPYTATIGIAVNALENVQAGGLFIDFSAPDLNGTSHTLSSLIKGKIAVLDLWASWCGPCIAKGIEMMPIYEQYKDKGFTVVGVAREFKNTKALEKALERTKYPWLNMLELDDQNRLWEKYNIPRSGGAVFLIDKKGKIVAVNPTAVEVKAYLENNIR